MTVRAGMARTAAIGVAVLAVPALATGCRVTGTKAGPAPPAVTLQLATVEDADAEYIDDARRFADEVGVLTNGSVTVTLLLEADAPWSPESEQRVTAMTKAGTTELAMVPPRVFDTIGIHGFEPLQTPFLIDSPELAGAITTGDIATGMLAELEQQGLVGLGLVYDGLRRPLAPHGALTAADQFDGLLIRVPISGMTFDMFSALGAVADAGANHRTATTGELYPAMETQLDIAASDYPVGSTVTANVVFFPKFNVLLANPAAFARLSSDQQGALRRAATDTVAAAVATTADDEAMAQSFCEGGRRVVMAAGSEVGAMRARVAPLVTRLRSDPATHRAVSAIEHLAGTLTIPPYRLPPACAPRTGDGAPLLTTPPPPGP